MHLQAERDNAKICFYLWLTQLFNMYHWEGIAALHEDLATWKSWRSLVFQQRKNGCLSTFPMKVDKWYLYAEKLNAEKL